MKITKTQLVDVAIQSIRQKNDLSMFWEYVSAARSAKILAYSDELIKGWLEEYASVIYGKGISLQESDKKDPTPVFGGRRLWSGEIDFPASTRYQPGAGAEQRASELAVRLAEKYGWRFTADGSSAHHDKLELHIYGCKKGRLRLITVNGMEVKNPCLRVREYGQEHTNLKDDILASLIVTCTVDKRMAEHIERYSPGHYARWREQIEERR